MASEASRNEIERTLWSPHMTETRVEECHRCGFPVVLEQDAHSEWSAYICPICGNGWAWRRT